MTRLKQVDEKQRLQALREHQILDTPAELVFDRIVQAAREICGVPIALISLVDERRQWFKAKVGLEVPETPREVAFCDKTIQQSDILVVPDARADERFRTNPLVVNDPSIRFYAGVPLVTPEGYALGTLCVVDYHPRTLTTAQLQSLKNLGRQTAIELRRRRTLAQLQSSVPAPQEPRPFFRRLAERATLTIGIIVSLAGLSLWSDFQVQERQKWVTHTLQVISEIDSANANIATLRWSAQAYIITAQEKDLADYTQRIRTLQQNIQRIRQLTPDNSSQQRNVERLETLMQQVQRNLVQIITLRRREGFTAASQLLGREDRVSLRSTVRNLLYEMREEEERLLKERSDVSQQTTYIASIISNLGRVVMILIIVTNFGLIRREIKQRRQAEEEKEVQRELLEVTLSSIGDGVVVTDANQQVTFMNPIAEILTGWPEAVAKEYSVQTVLPLVNTETGEPVESPFIQALAQEHTQGLPPNTGLRQPDGSIIPIDDSCAPIFNKQGDLQGAVMVFRDMTTRKQAELEIQRALEKEKDLNALRSGFVSMVSHDIRTPLAIIVSSAELLQHYADRLTEEKRTRYFEQIRGAVKRMQDLLEDVLLVTKTESGGLKYEPMPLNLEEFCRNLVEEVQMTAGKTHEILFSSAFESSHCCHQVYNMDSNLLHHIFINLLSNAVKYSPQGGNVYFEMKCGSNCVTFRVQDEGIGIPSEDIPNLFTSFHRARNVGKISGTGLGLAIAKSCVELHQGSIEVASELGKGTTFTVTLPLNHSVQAASPSMSRQTEGIPNGNPD